MVEYQARTPPTAASDKSRSVTEPTLKRRSGWVSRARLTMAGDRSIPKAFTPSESGWAVMRPVPQPRSAPGRDAGGSECKSRRSPSMVRLQ
jgi:hypothetical protein